MTEGALNEIAPGIWAAEAPLEYFGFPMGRRMTVIVLSTGGLLVHSPAELTAELRRGLQQLGDVRFVVAASRIHGHLYMEQYKQAYPSVKLYAAPGLASKREDLDFDGELSGVAEPAWSEDLDQALFEGHRRLTEVEFFHRATRTLITGDLCFNIGPSWPEQVRVLAWGGDMKPRLGPTTVFREQIQDREAARRSLELILEWDFDRILPGHGEIVPSQGRQLFVDGFRWLTD